MLNSAIALFLQVQGFTRNVACYFVMDLLLIHKLLLLISNTILYNPNFSCALNNYSKYKEVLKVGEMFLWLRGNTTLTENLSSALDTQVGHLDTSSQLQEIQHSPLNCERTCLRCTCTNSMCTHIQTRECMCIKK